MGLVYYHDLPNNIKLSNKNYYLAIVGSRSINEKKIVFEIIDRYVRYLVNKRKVLFDRIVIITGGAKGVDSFAIEYAKNNNLSYIVIKPDWKRYKKSAGFLRNRNIVKYANSVLAIISNNSKGTTHSIEIAKKMNKPCYVVNYNHYIQEKYVI